MKYVTIPRFSTLSGYTEKAVRNKIAGGVWIEGRHYHRAPDNRILIDIIEVEKWVESADTPALKSITEPSGLAFNIGESAVERL